MESRQHEIIVSDALLDEKGNIKEPGWARGLLPQYDRKAIKANPFRIKEWDYYLVCDDQFGVALTIADNSYMGLISASILDFTAPSETTKSVMEAFTRGKYGLPSTSKSGVTQFSGKNVAMRFDVTRDEETGVTERSLIAGWNDFLNGKRLDINITLTEQPTQSMVIATPFNKEAHFYYNQKINCMSAVGEARLGGKTLHVFKESAFATLDWGRGVWTYDNTWYWSNGNGIVNGKPLGFNLGYGFGDTSAASENLLIYEGKAHKLGTVKFNIPDNETGYMKPWTFTSDDGRFEMDFVPIIDRAARTNALIIESDQHQVFGRFTGKAVLDDGTALEIKDLLGFAEKVRNRY